MTSLGAIIRGLVGALSSPLLVIWLWVANVIVALPFAILVTSAISSSVGPSLAHERLREGFDMGWYGEYQSEATGIAATFRPSVIGVGAVLDNLESWSNADFLELPTELVAAGVIYALVWAFFLGGVLHRFHDPARLFRMRDFFGRSGEFFLRFVRLALVSAVGYYAVYRFGSWLFSWIEETTRDVTSERTVFSYVVAATLLVGFLLTLVHMVFDYAKISAFTENRRSMLLAMNRGLFFVLSHPGRCFTIYYGLAAVGIALFLLYAMVAPGAGGASPYQVAFGFVIGQLYLIAKITLRLSFYAAQMAYFESIR